MQNEKPEVRKASYTFTKRIGRTTYHVRVFFSETSKESLHDKLLRLIKNDIARGT